MFNHAPHNYICPFCSLIHGDYDQCESRKEDIIYQDQWVTAYISSRWRPNIEGIVLISPNKHFENLYDIEDKYLNRVNSLAKKIAIAMRNAYINCHGIFIKQSNEDAGHQDVWHYHLHVIPCNNRESFWFGDKYIAPEEKRREYADLLKRSLA